MSLRSSAVAPKRDPVDRLVVRFPGLAHAMAGGLIRLRYSSLRRSLVAVLVRRGFAAMARSDVEVVVLNYEPDAEVWMRDMAGVGIRECYRSHEGIRELYADLDEAFDDWRWTIRGVVDGGDRLAVRADFVGYGRGSGAETAVDAGATAVKYTRRGRIAWQEWFVEQEAWRRALAAVGLSE